MVCWNLAYSHIAMSLLGVQVYDLCFLSGVK